MGILELLAAMGITALTSVKLAGHLADKLISIRIARNAADHAANLNLAVNAAKALLHKSISGQAPPNPSRGYATAAV